MTPQAARRGTVPASPARPGGGQVANGLAEQVAAVEAARAKLGEDLDQLNVEVRAQMSHTLEKTTWKVVATGSAILTGILMRKLIGVVWAKASHRTPPTNPGAPGTSWGEGLAWALASGAGYGVGRLVATHTATEGWRRITGVLPPGVEDVGV